MSVCSVCVGASVFVSVAALSIAEVSSSSAQSANAETSQQIQIPADFLITEAHIAFLKYALNLRPAQMQQWAPVEAALNDMARWQATAPMEVSTGQTVRPRSEAAIAARLRRIATVAGPLIKVLDEDQKAIMILLARNAGLEQLLALSQ